MRDGRVQPGASHESVDEPRRVGSLQKAWVLEAWAETHPTDPLPRVTCDAASRCWLPSGHGPVGLRAATARSCNAYFLRLAESTPPSERAFALRRAGFEVPGESASAGLSSAAAIGLVAGEGAPAIAPARLLAAYVHLVTVPWPLREDVRREWLDGMRDAAESGTAGGAGLRGLLAKTGTVEADASHRTSGWAVFVDPSGRSAWLGYLPRGTGAEAAALLGEQLAGSGHGIPRTSRSGGGGTARSRGGSLRAVPARVRVRLFTSLRPEALVARNLSSAPLRRQGPSPGWIAPGVEVALRPGETLQEGDWELRVAPYGLVREVRGSLEVSTLGSTLKCVLTTSPRDYLEGVLRGELGPRPSTRSEALASVALRLLTHGSRHGREDVCDLSHCGRFVAFGPEVSWPTPTRAVVLARSGGGGSGPLLLDDAAFERALTACSRPGPTFWSEHCGGEPLSARAVWGGEDDAALTCPRHAGASASSTASWRRVLPDDALASALGDEVLDLAAEMANGVRVTRARLRNGERRLLYDELHALLARRLGWDALPSPPDRFTREARGWVAEGRGSGHRVGLCLSD